MKKHIGIIKSAVALTFMFLLVITSLSLLSGSKAYAAGNGQNRMNVVFVIDDSGSMVRKDVSDPNKLRYEAMELFLALSTESGNYIGAVKFNDSIIKTINLGELNGKSAKEAFYDSASAGSSDGGTDIGQALNEATKMLLSNANPQLDSVIILLTDGNTSLDNASQLAESNKLKQDAIDVAKNQGIKVFSICLNANGNADMAEVEDISDATNGKCVEVKNANDLNNVFTMFYNMIYSTDTQSLADETLGPDGELDIEFTIPDIGVEEANIIINTVSTNISYSLKDPKDYRYTTEETDQFTIKAKTFKVIKLSKPETGQWVLTVRGIPGDKVQVNLVYNNNIEISLSDISSGAAKLKKPVSLDVAVTNCGTLITDPEIFKKNPIYLVVKNLSTGSSDEFAIPDGKTSYDLTFDQIGEYEVYSFIEVDGVRQLSESIRYSFTNTAPTATDIYIKKTVFPFTADETVDLSKHAQDVEDAVLTYKIVDSELKDGTYDVSLDQLTVQVSKSGSGVIEIAATDSNGASVTFVCEVEVVNAFIIVIIIALVILALIGLVIIMINHKYNTALINGTIKLSAFGDGQTSAVETVDGMRGKMYIGRNFNFRINTGLNLGQCYFHAGDRDDRIVFVSKTGYYTDYDSSKRNKKIVLDDQVPVTIYSNEDFKSGIKVTYKSEGGMGMY